MSLYVNGKKFSLDLFFPLKFGLPYIKVRMTRNNTSVEVVGIINTAIRNSILDFKTAHALGIKNPRKNGIKQTFQTATQNNITYYLHTVMIHVSVPNVQPFVFPTIVGFAKKVEGVFFGMDWTMNFCLAVDRQNLHLLRD